MNAVEKHPQRQEIIDAILSGKALRAVAATIDPPLHYATLSRFRVGILGKATRTMRGRSETTMELKTLADAHGVGSAGENGPALVQEQLRQELQLAAVRFEERRERWISEAEKRPVLDKLGNPVLDADESVVRMLDHKALASHDRNNLASLELRAKIAGVLQGDATPVQQVAVFVLPGQPEAAGGQVIEIEATR